MRALPIRIRLSLWYFAMFASAAFLLSMMSWWMLRRSVDATEYHEMQERADDVRVLLNQQESNIGLNALQEIFAETYQSKDDGKWLQVRGQGGNWIYRSPRMVEENPPLPPPDRIPMQGILTDFHQGTRFVRVLACPVTAQGRHYSVQTGVALNKSLALLDRFRAGLLLLTPAIILLAGLGGHFMSRRLLQPVSVLASEARRINDRNLDVRLPVSPANDEISDLSRTLNQMLERIDNAFASVRAFTGNASHELRTPIALLRTEIEVALYRPREAEGYRATLRRLLEETVRMTNLVEQLLSLARADGGAEAMSLTSLNLSELFQRIEQSWTPIAERAMLDFRAKLSNQSLFILGDPAGIERLLTILLENAIQYTPPGGAVILSALSAGSSVVLSVRDTGIGISNEDKPRIFDRFYRASQTSNSVQRGSGLGLALARWIAECHGAQLTVESEPGKGSCFSLSLTQAAPVVAKATIFNTSQVG
jgi:two-component system, OmpR family, heavy metal sensor histidine kinase CusS